MPTWAIPIHVEYELLNTTPNVVHAQIGFPLAPCSLSDFIANKSYDFLSGGSATCVKQPRMALLVDGHKVTGRWDFVFLRDGKPFGAGEDRLAVKIKALIGLVRDPVDKFYAEDSVFLASAKNLCAEMGGRMVKENCTAFGAITVHQTFLWEFAFAPGRTVHVVHDYTVNASWNIEASEAYHFDAFCLADPEMRTVWAKHLADLKRAEDTGRVEDAYPTEFFTEYVLKTGALWAGPIKDFELLIRKSAAAQMVSTCFSGRSKTGPLEFSAHRSDFTPTEDLRVLYLPAPAK